MSPDLLSPELLIVVGLALMVVGAGMLWVSQAGTRTGSRRGTGLGGRRCRARWPAPLWGRSGALVGAAFVGGVIAGVQWVMVVSTATPPVAPSAAWMLVLGVPGFMAGATVVRLLAVIAIVLHRRSRPPVKRERGGRR